MGYDVTMTRAGYELQAKLFAEGGDLVVTKVEVGSGMCPPDADRSQLTALVERRAAATATVPQRRGCEVGLMVEYRSDLNGGLEEPFQIREFAVFALGAEGTEILMLHGDLSDYPETAVPQKYGGCVRRYPVNIIIGEKAGAELAFPSEAWIASEDLAAALHAHDGDRGAHLGLWDRVGGLAETAADAGAALVRLASRVTLMELMFRTQVKGNPFTVTFESLEGLDVAGVWNAAQGRVEF